MSEYAEWCKANPILAEIEQLEDYLSGLNDGEQDQTAEARLNELYSLRDKGGAENGR